MTKKPKRRTPPHGAASPEPTTLATVLASMEQPDHLSPTRLRDLRSAVKRVAVLLGDEPAAIPLDIGAISHRLAAVNPVAVGVTTKRFANMRSDFLAAVKASGMRPGKDELKSHLSPAWLDLFKHLSGRRAHIGLSRLARYASAHGLTPQDINDVVIVNFIAAVREQTLCTKPNTLHRQVTQIWNEAARDPTLGLAPVTVASFRGPPKRIDWSHLADAFKKDVEAYLSWCAMSDPFAAAARTRALAPATIRLRRDQIHAAVSALVECGREPSSFGSLADVVSPENAKAILRRRLAGAGGQENAFNHNLGKALVQIAYEWVKPQPSELAELKRVVAKLPVPLAGLTPKNKRFLRQFDDPAALRRLYTLPYRLWSEVKRDKNPSFRTLAKAQAALGVAILSYMPLRPENLRTLKFDTNLFLQEGRQAISTLELSAAEVKNRTELAFDIRPHVAKMLIEYRDHIAPRIIGHRPTHLFVNIDGALKEKKALSHLIATYSQARAGIVLTPHQFRHLSAKVMLDAEPGAFETVRQALGHKSDKTTVGFYAGIDSRRAARHHARLVEQALANAPVKRRRRAK